MIKFNIKKKVIEIMREKGIEIKTVVVSLLDINEVIVRIFPKTKFCIQDSVYIVPTTTEKDFIAQVKNSREEFIKIEKAYLAKEKATEEWDSFLKKLKLKGDNTIKDNTEICKMKNELMEIVKIDIEQYRGYLEFLDYDRLDDTMYALDDLKLAEKIIHVINKDNTEYLKELKQLIDDYTYELKDSGYL